MSVQILFDDFTSPGAMVAPWVQATGDDWQSNGQRAEPLSTPNTIRRMMLNQDPYLLLGGFAPPTSPKIWRTNISFRTPDVYSGTDELRMGMVLMSPASPDNAIHLVCQWRRTSGSAQYLTIWGMNGASIAVNIYNYPLIGTNQALEGTRHSLGIIINIASSTTCTMNVFWDGIGVGQIPTVTAAQLNAGGFIGSLLTMDHYTGLYALIPGPADGGGDPLYPGGFDSWEVLDAGPLATAPDPYPAPAFPATPNLATVAVSAEGLAPSALTLPIQPSYAYDVEDAIGVTEMAFDSGDTVARPTTDPRRAWRLVWGALNATDRDTLVAFLKAARGTLEDWTWTHPETGEVLRGRCASDPDLRPLSALSYTVSANVEEVLDAS